MSQLKFSFKQQGMQNLLFTIASDLSLNINMNSSDEAV